MANYPTSLDTFTNPTAASAPNSPSHASQHSVANDAIAALETKLGTGSSTAASGKLLRGTGAGASAWDKDAPTGTIVGTTDTQTLTNKTLTTPVIGDFSSATHNHSNSAGGGTLGQSTVDGTMLGTSAIKLGYAEITANFTDTTVGSYVDVTGLSAAVTVPAGGRDLLIWAYAGGYKTSAVAGTTLTWAIREGSTVLGTNIVNEPVSAYNITAICQTRVSAPSSGSHTYKVSIGQNAAGTMTVEAGTANPSFGNYAPAYILVVAI